MFQSNFHSHCIFCDGRSSMEEFVKYAIAKGLRKYGFSSHAPVPFHTSWTMDAGDLTDYQNEFYRLKDKYSDQIELYLGLEIDYIPGCTNARSTLFAGLKLDYSIGSVHYLDLLSNGSYWSIDGPFEEFETGINELFEGDIRKATKQYYKVMIEMVQLGGFDIVGHADKITMHGSRYPDFDIRSDWYKKLFTDFLLTVKEKGLILEINTKAFVSKGITYPDMSYFSLLKDLRIPVTVNSDCHYPDKVTDGFTEAYQALKDAGFADTMQLTARGWQSFAI